MDGEKEWPIGTNSDEKFAPDVGVGEFALADDANGDEASAGTGRTRKRSCWARAAKGKRQWVF